MKREIKTVTKRVISLFLALLMVFTLLPLSAFATNDDNASYEAEQDINYKATNTLGSVITAAMDDETDDDADYNDGRCIYDVALNFDKGLTAEVSCCTDVGATIVVAVYEEETMQMVTSGKADIPERTDHAKITLTDCDLPDNFVVKAFMLDENNTPLCKNRENLDYTKKYREFFEKNISDFDEERVINLDASAEDNFAVIAEGAVTVREGESSNVLITNDFENGVYAFENADKEILSLKPGDIFYFACGNGENDYILTKVGSVKTSGNVTTVTSSDSDDIEISDFFEYIDIDTSKYVDPTSAIATYASFDDEHGDTRNEQDVTHSAEFNKNFGDNLKLSGKIAFVTHFKFYYDFRTLGEDYCEIDYWVKASVSGSVTVSVAAKKEFEPLVLFMGSIPIYAGIEAEIEFSLKFTFSVKASFTCSLTLSMKKGMSYCTDTGRTEYKGNPEIELKGQINADITIDLTAKLSVGIKVLKVIKVALAFDAGLSVKLTLLDISLGVKYDFAKKGIKTSFKVDGTDMLHLEECHLCSYCADGDVKFHTSGYVEFTFGICSKSKSIAKIYLFSNEQKLCDFYLSLFNDLDDIEFGIGECPHYAYKTTFKTVDEKGDILSDVAIKIDGHIITSDEKGQCTMLITKGSFRYFAEAEGYEVADGQNLTAEITGKSKSYTVKMKEKEYDVTYKVVDENGKSVKGATIVCKGEYLTTDSLGLATQKLKNGSYTADITADGYTLDESKNPNISFNVQKTNTIVTIYMQTDGGIMEITVVDEDNKPLSSATVDIKSDSGETISLKTDSNGMCSDKLKKGNYTATAAIKGYTAESPVSFTIESKVKKTVKITMKKAEITWTLDDDGTLTISGAGEMTNYIRGGSPWYRSHEIKNVIIEDGITSIGNCTFEQCYRLESITIPDSVTYIGKDAFYECEALESVEIPNSVTYIGEFAFIDCKSIKHLTISNSITSIDQSVFAGCQSLTSVIIPDSVTNIGSHAFDNCTNLTNVTIPDSVTNIDYCAFEYCTSLTSIIIPDSVITIGDFAFNACYSLVNITIPNGVTNIGRSTFLRCKSLSSITIPRSVKNITNGAFNSCDSLKTVYFTGTQNEWQKIAIGNANNPLTSATIIYNYTPAAKLMSMPMSLSYDMPTVFAADGKYTETVSNTVPGREYIIIAVKDKNAKDLLSPENLLYIDQKTADGNTLTFTFTPRENCPYDVVIGFTHSHSFGDWHTVIEPSADSEGLEERACTVCGAKETRVTDKLAVDDFVPGDVDGDGKVIIKDARLALRIAAKLDAATDQQKKAADVDGDGKVTVTDARLILRFSARLISSFK